MGILGGKYEAEHVWEAHTTHRHACEHVLAARVVATPFMCSRMFNMSRQRHWFYLVMTYKTLLWCYRSIFIQDVMTRSNDRKGQTYVLIFHSQNVWQAWHDWDFPFRQDKAEEDRDKRKKPSAHQREWVSLMSLCVFLNKTKALIPPCNNFPVSHYSSLPALSKDYMLSKLSTKRKTNGCYISTLLIYSIPLSYSLNTSLLI